MKNNEFGLGLSFAAGGLATVLNCAGLACWADLHPLKNWPSQLVQVAADSCQSLSAEKGDMLLTLFQAWSSGSYPDCDITDISSIVEWRSWPSGIPH